MMRERFPTYYRPSEAEFTTLWNEAVFVFDTNVLLNLYRYTSDTREKVLIIMERLAPRIWLPHQIADEYHRQRLDRIVEQHQPYTTLATNLAGFQKGLTTVLDNLGKRHPFMNDIWELIEQLQTDLTAFEQRLNTIREHHPDLLHADPVLDRLTHLFDDADRVGPPYTDEQLTTHQHTADERFQAHIPPGYSDRKKPLPQRYGDILIWFQMLDYAREHQRPLIFVTDDGKADWWLQKDGKTLGPRRELRQEMQTEAQVAFYMYAQEPFLTYAQRFFDQAVDTVVIDEVQAVRAATEERLDAQMGQQLAQMMIASFVNQLQDMPKEVLQDTYRDTMKQFISAFKPETSIFDTTPPQPLFEALGILGHHRNIDDEEADEEIDSTEEDEAPPAES